MRLYGSRIPTPLNPFEEFDGEWGGAAVQALIDATPAYGTLELPGRIFTLQTLTFRQPITVVCPPGGTKIYGSLAVQPRPLRVGDPGYAQISPSVRSSVEVIDLKGNGITDWGAYLPFTGPNTSGGSYAGWSGGWNVTALAPPALICNDRQMELTRYQNGGYPGAVDEPWSYVANSLVASDNSHFTDSTLPDWNEANWTDSNLMAVTLYPWFDSVNMVGSEAYDYFTSAVRTGADEVVLTNAIPSTDLYGALQNDTRYVIQNILEALTVAGQYYIDVNSLLIYFLPPAGVEGPLSYRVSWITDPLVALYADIFGGCSGISFTGGPLGLYGSRGHGLILQAGAGGTACPSDVSFAGLQAFGIGQDAVQLETTAGNAQPAGFQIGALVVDWCGGCGLWYGPSSGTGSAPGPVANYPKLDAWGSTFGELFFARTSQWCRTYRGAAHFNCVGCSVESITSYQNSNHHLLHDSHDFVLNSGYFDGSFMEGGDVGIIYSGQDPTIFGTEFNNISFLNIPSMTDATRGAFPGRRALYIDNWGSGVTARNLMCTNCNSTDTLGNPDYCVYIHGGQAITIDGVSTSGCVARPVGILPDEGAPWAGPSGMAYLFVTSANNADGRYQARYGIPWLQLLSADPAPGAPRNISVLRVFPGVGSGGQEDLNSLGFDVPINQPQGAVSGLTDPPFPPPAQW